MVRTLLNGAQVPLAAAQCEQSTPLLEKFTTAEALVFSKFGRPNSSIGVLPPEVLGLVFAEAVLNDKSRDESYHPQNDHRVMLPTRETKPMPSTRASIRLMGVCRLWRDIILSTPSLWTYIVLDGRQSRCKYHAGKRVDVLLASLCLTRSGTRPLSVAVRDLTAAQRTWMSVDLLPHIARIKNLCLFISQDVVLESILSCFQKRSTPFKLLTRLTLVVAGNIRDASPSIDKLLGSIPSTLPELCVVNVPQWFRSCFANLRVLLLQGSCNGVTFEQFLTFLSHTPHLEELCIYGQEPEGVRKCEHLPLALHRLRGLYLSGVTSVFVATFLAHIMPPVVHLGVTNVASRGGDRSQLQDANSMLQAVSGLVALRTSHTLQLADNGRVLCLSGVGPCCSFLLDTTAGASILNEPSYLRTLSDFLVALPVTDVWLCRDQIIRMPPAAWPQILRGLPSVTRLILGPEDDSFDALLSFIGDDISLGLETFLPLPQLRTLVLLGTNKLPCGRSVDTLGFLLKRRKTRSIPLQLTFVLNDLPDGDTDVEGFLCARWQKELNQLTEFAAAVRFVHANALEHECDDIGGLGLGAVY